MKITFTLLLAKQLEWLREEKRDLKSFPAAAMVAGHTLLLMGYYVVISGDMGNALTFFFIFLCMAFAAGSPCGGSPCCSPALGAASPLCCCWTSYLRPWTIC